jgi:hypothetical protein
MLKKPLPDDRNSAECGDSVSHPDNITANQTEPKVELRLRPALGRFSGPVLGSTGSDPIRKIPWIMFVASTRPHDQNDRDQEENCDDRDNCLILRSIVGLHLIHHRDQQNTSGRAPLA